MEKPACTLGKPLEDPTWPLGKALRGCRVPIVSPLWFRGPSQIKRKRHPHAFVACFPSTFRPGSRHETQTDPNKTVSNAGTKSAPNCVTKFRHEIQSAPARNFVTNFGAQIMCKNWVKRKFVTKMGLEKNRDKKS